MEVFRLARRKYAMTLTGIGAALKGARWNSMGVELIYTAQNRSLAMAEVAVHLTLATLPGDYCMITIVIPDDMPVAAIDSNELPLDWNHFPHPVSTQKFGDRFVAENKYCILKVPSVVTRGDYNFLINPHHKDFSRVTILKVEDFPLDRRIFR